MRKSSACVVIFSVLLGASTVAPALASGSYSGRPPQPPARNGDSPKIDRDRYALGKNVYEGSVRTPAGGDAAAQTPRLKAAQMQLPADAMKSKDLPAMAGKLSAAQLDALEYYVAHRFGTKK